MQSTSQAACFPSSSILPFWTHKVLLCLAGSTQATAEAERTLRTRLWGALFVSMGIVGGECGKTFRLLQYGRCCFAVQCLVCACQQRIQHQPGAQKSIAYNQQKLQAIPSSPPYFKGFYKWGTLQTPAMLVIVDIRGPAISHQKQVDPHFGDQENGTQSFEIPKYVGKNGT